jgi:hypothetical protein
MNTLNSKDLQITVKKTEAVNINCPVPFLKHVDRRQQSLLIDEPNEIYYNPSTKTLHADNFSGGIPSLVEGEAIQLTTANNSTEIDVNFTKNTEVVTEILDNDTFLLSNTSNSLKTITGEKLKENIRLTAGDNLEYGTGVNSNKLSLKTALTNTSLNSGTTWNGNLILATKLSDGSVSDAEFQRLNGLTSDILESSDKNIAFGVCGLDANGIISNAQLPSSVNDIIEVANFASLPSTGESSKIYVTLDNHKAYRWGGSSYVEISASLVLGTSSGTAYDGASGQTNADNIALKQNILVDSATSGILIDGNNNIDIDLTRTTAETTFDDNELMLIQKINGDLCRLTKQQLKSSINTNTEYNNGANITIDGSNNINLNSNISTNYIETKTNFVLRAQTTNNADYLNNIVYQNTGNFFNIGLTRRYNGVSNRSNFCIQTGGSSVLNNLPIRLCVTHNGNVNIGSSQNKTHGFNVEGTSNFENIITGTTIDITGTYKIGGTDLSGSNLNYSAGVTINAEIDSKQDILTFGKSIGNSLKLQDAVVTNDVLLMGASNVIGKTYPELKSLLSLNNVENIAVSSLGGNNLFFSSNKLNLDIDLTNIDSISASGDLSLKANDEIILLSGNDGSSSGEDFVFRTNRGSGILEIMRLNGATANLGIDISPHSTYKLNVGGDINIPSGSNYKIGGVNLSGSNLNYSSNNSINAQIDTKASISNPTLTGVLNFTGSKIDINPASGNSAVLQLHSDAGRYTINAEHTNGDFQIYDNDNGRSVFRYFQATSSTTINGDLNLSSGSSYKIDNIDVLSDDSISSVKNFVLNARIIQNLNSSKDGLFINYMTGGVASNAHCRFYSGGNTTERMFIEGSGNVGINTVNPTEKLEVNGNINITNGNDYKIDGTAIVHSYIDGTNISIGSNKSINLNSPLTGISGIQNTGDTVFTRNSVQICKVGVNGFEMLNSKKFIGDIQGPIKPYIIRDINNFDQPIVSYRALSTAVTQLPPNQMQLILPDANQLITINHSTGLLKTKNIYVDGTITNANSITATQFVGTLSGNATTVTNGVYLNNTGNQNIVGTVACGGIVSKASKTVAESLAQNSNHGSGTLAFGVGTTSTDKFDVYFYMRSNVTAQAVYGSFSATQFGSDDRRKHNEKPIENALDSIMKLQPEIYEKTFVFKDENFSGNIEDEAHWLESGLIAQDVYKIPEFKEYVKVGNETISWDINYNCIFSYNIKATQELKLENDKLKNEVIELKKTNKNLIDKMYELELKMELILKNLNLATL